MNWTWSIRSGDGGMNGLEFTKATTAGDFKQVFVHAAPAQLQIEVRRADDDVRVASGEVERDGDYTPMTLLTLNGGAVSRAEIWPSAEHFGLPVLLAGGEVGILRGWEHADDRSWWRWQVEFSNHTGRPDDWSPPAGG
jgi:hypothetical protein